jgi:hypothetical protein
MLTRSYHFNLNLPALFPFGSAGNRVGLYKFHYCLIVWFSRVSVTVKVTAIYRRDFLKNQILMLCSVANLLNQKEKMIITHVLLKDGTDGSFDGDCEVGDTVTVRLHNKD